MLKTGKLLLMGLMLISSSVFAQSTINKTSLITDSVGGTSDFTTTGTIATTGTSFNIAGAFKNFIIVDGSVKITATGSLKSKNTSNANSGTHTLDGNLDLTVAKVVYKVVFTALQVTRTGQVLQYSGTMTVNGTVYPIGSGSLASQIITAITDTLEM